MRRGSFLPQVWKSLPAPADFLAHLKHKAGIGWPLRPEDGQAAIFTAWSAGAVTMYPDDETAAIGRYN